MNIRKGLSASENKKAQNSHESYLIIIYKVSDAPGRSWYKGVSIENTELEK